MNCYFAWLLLSYRALFAIFNHQLENGPVYYKSLEMGLLLQNPLFDWILQALNQTIEVGVFELLLEGVFGCFIFLKEVLKRRLIFVLVPGDSG